MPVSEDPNFSGANVKIHPNSPTPGCCNPGEARPGCARYICIPLLHFKLYNILYLLPRSRSNFIIKFIIILNKITIKRLVMCNYLASFLPTHN